MRDPHRTRNVRLGLAFGVAWPAFAAAVAVGDDLPVAWVVPAVGVAGLHAGLILTTLGLMRHRDARRLDRMRRGEGVLARWTVDQGRWLLYLDHCRRLAAQPGARRNMLALPARLPVVGYHVTVSDDAIRLEDEFEPMRGDAEVRVAGAVLEFRQLVPVGRRMEWRSYQLPVGAGAERDAERVAAHYAASRRVTRPARAP